jgi:hypothetical protein
LKREAQNFVPVEKRQSAQYQLSAIKHGISAIKFKLSTIKYF